MTGRADEDDLRRRARAVLARPHPRGLRRRSEEIRRRCSWFFTDGRGARLTTPDGRRLLDLEMGRGPVLLGYRPHVLENLRAAALGPPLTSLLSEDQVEAAELLVGLFPCAEKVVFARNGSDACTAAVRVARALTGRAIILSSGFHGFHDWCAADYDWVSAGLPDAYRGLVKSFALNDVEGLARLVESHRHEVAAIMVELGRMVC